VLSKFLPEGTQTPNFFDWARHAPAAALARVLAAITGEGGEIVRGRSRGNGRRSPPRLEPVILGQVRGKSSAVGGRSNESEHRVALITYLAADWAGLTGEIPLAGRGPDTPFGWLIYSVFGFLGFEEFEAEYAMRIFWEELNAA